MRGWSGVVYVMTVLSGVCWVGIVLGVRTCMQKGVCHFGMFTMAKVASRPKPVQPGRARGEHWADLDGSTGDEVSCHGWNDGWEVFGRGIRCCAWNAGGLFGAVDLVGNESEKRRRKLGYFRRLAAGHDIVFVFEARGVDTDLAEIRDILPGFTVAGTFDARGMAGGVFACVRDAWVPEGKELMFRTIRSSRTLSVEIIGGGDVQILRVVGVHLVWNWEVQFDSAMRDIQEVVTGTLVPSVLMGDFNIVSSVEGRLRVGQKARSYNGGTQGRRLEKILSLWTELHDGMFTRRGMHANGVEVLSRIDRIFVNIPATIIS